MQTTDDNLIERKRKKPIMLVAKRQTNIAKPFEEEKQFRTIIKGRRIVQKSGSSNQRSNVNELNISDDFNNSKIQITIEQRSDHSLGEETVC